MIEEPPAKINPVADGMSLAQGQGLATHILWTTDFKLADTEISALLIEK